MRKTSSSRMAISIYTLLTLVTATAIAIPPAVATNILPDTTAGALVLIGSIALLLLTLVIEVWRQTGNGNNSPVHNPPPQRQKRRPISRSTDQKRSKT